MTEIYEEAYNRHYIRVDENSNIIRGFSDAFEQPVEGDICINPVSSTGQAWGGYQFRLYSDGEENPPLCGDMGEPLYRYVDGTVITNPPYEPDPAVILEQQKTDAIKQTKTWVASELAEPMEWSDGKMYTVTLEKQNMLSNQLGMYERNDKAGVESPLMWNAAGEACEAWTYEALSALSNAMAAHVAPIVAKQQYAEIRIRQAVTADEIQAVLDGFVL